LIASLALTMRFLMGQVSLWLMKKLPPILNSFPYSWRGKSPTSGMHRQDLPTSIGKWNDTKDHIDLWNSTAHIPWFSYLIHCYINCMHYLLKKTPSTTSLYAIFISVMEFGRNIVEKYLPICTSQWIHGSCTCLFSECLSKCLTKTKCSENFCLV
jgi:hypothetical protein